MIVCCLAQIFLDLWNLLKRQDCRSFSILKTLTGDRPFSHIILYSKCKWIFRRFDLPFAAARGLCERKCRWGWGGGGNAEFLARRLEEYKRTPRVMYGRVRSRPRTTAPESTHSGFGTFNTDINELQITITCNTKQWLSLWRQYRRVKYYVEFTGE